VKTLAATLPAAPCNTPRLVNLVMIFLSWSRALRRLSFVGDVDGEAGARQRAGPKPEFHSTASTQGPALRRRGRQRRLSAVPAREKILIDCDPGHDDAVAILFAAKHMDLVGVTTVHGNSPLKNTTRNALATLELAGLDIPVAAGSAAPMIMAETAHRTLHGKTGLDGADIPPPRTKPIAAHAIDFIIDQAARHKGELIVAITGPQTNLALALKREPRLAKWVREFTIMGGSTTTGNTTPAAEFNIWCDPEAASVVFESGVPCRMVGYNITRTTGFDKDDIARMRKSRKRTAAVISDLMAFYLARQGAAYGLTVAPMHDVCAIVPYVDDSLIRHVETSVKVELNGSHTRGMTVCDLRNVQPEHRKNARGYHEPNAKVAVEAKSRPLINLVIDTLLGYP
jgi:inosine-uridine nucleoside N-ribohydrolase